MKKIVSLVLTLVLCACACLTFASCGNTADYNVGVCQLMKHDSLDQATQGFVDALEEAMEKAGKTIDIDVQVAGESNLCATVINTFTSKKVDLIMGNATPALLAAANATKDIPVLGTSVTDYSNTFGGKVPANVSGTSDAVPFDQQAQMMIDTLGLKEGDQVGVIYCLNESNSVIQYEAVKKHFEANSITVKAYTFSDTTELQTVVTNAANNSKAIYVPSDNTVADNDNVLAAVCGDKVPVYTSYAGSVCYASLAIDYYQLGVETGKMAAEILLNGKTPADFEVKTLTPSTSFNEELCGKLGISVDKK